MRERFCPCLTRVELSGRAWSSFEFFAPVDRHRGASALCYKFSHVSTCKGEKTVMACCKQFPNPDEERSRNRTLRCTSDHNLMALELGFD